MKKSIKLLNQGKIIAYPTEAVYGLGCDPFNEEAVNKLKQLKDRKPSQGFILIAASWSQVQDLCEPIPDEKMKLVNETWPGPTTWIFPATKKAPQWVCSNKTIAIRITDHPLAKALCNEFGGPIVSTSANPANKTPAKTAKEVKSYFKNTVDYILEGELGTLSNPTQIRDALTGNIFRN